MKKLMFVLALLVLAVPVWAATTVEITCGQVEPNSAEIAIGYIKTGDGRVRAFALDIYVLTKVGCPSSPMILDVNCVSADYYIYPGSIGINEQGEVTDEGSCVCDDSYADTLPGPPDSNGVTIEMGSLYDDVPPLDDPEHQTPPPDSGTLLILTVDGDCRVVVKENVLRGGIVLEDPQATAALDLPDGNDCLALGIDCIPQSDPKYGQWLLQGKPLAWCCPGQDKGDTDGDGDVDIFDLFALRLSYGLAYSAAGYDCRADFDHDGDVDIFDLFALRLSYGGPTGGGVCPVAWKNDCGTCGTGPCP